MQLICKWLSVINLDMPMYGSIISSEAMIDRVLYRIRQMVMNHSIILTSIAHVYFPRLRLWK